MAPVLELRGLTKRVGGPPRTLFDGLTLQLSAGETVAVCGRSGCGKSTLLNLCGGMDTVHDGQVCVEGRVLRDLSEDERSDLRLRTVGFVFQAFHLVDHLTLLQNVMLPARFLPRAEGLALMERARLLLETVGLGGRAQDRPSILSGGERQRVAIARALVMKPRLLLADEPTGNLDRETAAGVLDLFSRMTREEGVAVLLVTHDAAVAARADRTVWLRDGLLHAEAA